MIEQRLGMVLGSTVGPDGLAPASRAAEQAGFGELWLSEDFFFTGGIAGAGIALAATETMQVGLGVVSAVVRHPALLAMELASLGAAHPGRFVPGVGLGVPAWMRQMGLMPDSPLTAVRECVTMVKRLLAGETVTEAGSVFESHDVGLVYGAPTDLPVRMGVSGPRMLQLAGEVADGSILSVGAGTDYVRWARERTDEGRARAGRTDHHAMTVFTIYAVDADGDRARAAARSTLAFYKAAGGRNALTEVAGISDQVEQMLARGGKEAVEAEMPDEWVDALTTAGTPTDVVAGIRALLEAGADSVALVPADPTRLEETIELTASEVIGSV